MIKAIIFDCFGVLTTEGWLGFKQRHFSGRPAERARATELNRQLDAGLIGYQEGVRAIADMAGVVPRELDNILRNVVPNDELLIYIAQKLKPKYRLGILSNVAGNWLESFFPEEDLRLFDVIILSYESGVLKPDPLAYKTVAGRLDSAPKECVFIDDMERNVTGARQAGMQTILYKDFEQMRTELEPLLAVDAKG